MEDGHSAAEFEQQLCALEQVRSRRSLFAAEKGM